MALTNDEWPPAHQSGLSLLVRDVCLYGLDVGRSICLSGSIWLLWVYLAAPLVCPSAWPYPVSSSDDRGT